MARTPSNMLPLGTIAPGFKLKDTNSNNTYSKMIGIFVAFRWIYAWVEDINNFSLTTYFLWVIIGFCLSSKFRKLTNLEIKIWIQGIFEKKYRRHFIDR